MGKNYHILTYGCQMNVHESEKIAGALKELGYSGCERVEDADVIVFNTCCIRENAENHLFGNLGMLKKLKAANKNLIIAVGGCLPQQTGKAELLHKKFPYVDIIFGTHNLNRLKDYIILKQGRKKAVVEIEECDGKVIEGEPTLRTSYPNAWVNITYGCNNFCSYCIVPYVRGRERSRSPENVIKEVEELVKGGYKEITLLGQNVNSYGNGSDYPKFYELLEKVAAVDGKFRVRFMTSHPKDFSEELAKTIAANPKICHLVHLPVQSGSNAILSKMNRRYTVEDYIRKVEILKKYVPDCAITTDIIVGFPGETEKDFEDTLKLVEEVNFASAFTFVYSKREGTKAAAMPDQIAEDVSRRRIMTLIELVNEKTRRHSLEFLGKTTEVLCEDYDDKKGVYLGRNQYGRMVYFPYAQDVVGRFVNVDINEANGISLFGKVSKIFEE